ncbi:hypothetical protein J2Z62_000407 [Mycoplasmoides fastidiosum]|uniref:Lipoprotein n=1 Tax=Mycoplasmoides fastidiosum TaxID=92758 RepID=A0ABU0LZ39_9BACT|nr:hypothetical protein [Mycoplasmoides fastidiosum]MDQ0513969.1 hypothetical protein [Mycoplasmoides fastidiosum]UUD37617.1 hypothetical protein NPA10_03555 [Mycoplasmoides fastidiosum]
MKKLNFLHRKKFGLTGFSVATTSSIVLAACANNAAVAQNNNTGNNSNQPNQNDANGINNSNNSANSEPNAPNQSDQNNLDKTKKSDNLVDQINMNSSNSSNNASTTNPLLKVPQATVNQIAATKHLLQQAEIKTVLTIDKEKALEKIRANIVTVSEVGKFSQETIATSKTALGNVSDEIVTTIDGTSEKSHSVMALLKTLESQLTTSAIDTSIIPVTKKDEFSQTIKNVKKYASNLLIKLNTLPSSKSANTTLLNTAKQTFETALEAYAKSTTQDNSWTTLKNAHENYHKKLKQVIPQLIEVQKAAFDVDKATSLLETFVNHDVATFLSDKTNGTKHSHILNALVSKVRINVLGTAGYDLWAEDSAPFGIEDDTNPSTQLYAIVVGLADQNAAWSSLNKQMKVLTYNQSLLINNDSAVNFLALHLNTLLPVDVSRLNAYLTVDASNVLKILNPVDKNVSEILAKIANGSNQYSTLLTGDGTNTLVKKLETLATKVSDSGRQTKVNALKTAAEKLKNLFTSFQTEWDKLQKLLWIKNESNKITYPLLEGAANLNRLIALSNNYGDVLQVVAQGQALRKLSIEIATILYNPLGNDSQPLNKKSLMYFLEQIITEIKSMTEGSFGKALSEFASENQWEESAKSDAEAIAHSSTSGTTTTNVGLIYADLVEGTTSSTNQAAKLSFEQLKTELEKLQNNSGNPLSNLLSILSLQLQPSDGSQTARLTNHLIEIFNNGNILPETEIHDL